MSEPVAKEPVKLTQLLNEQEVTRLVSVPSLLKAVRALSESKGQCWSEALGEQR